MALRSSEHETCNREIYKFHINVFSHLGIYKLSINHGYKSFSIFCKAFIGQGQTSTGIFSSSQPNDFVSGGFAVSHTKIIM